MSSNLGTKRVCPKCEAKFYDFGVTDPIKCPKCGHGWKEGAKKKVAPAVKEARPAKPKKIAQDDESMLEMAGDLPEIEDGGDVEELEPMEDDGVELTSLEEVEEHEDDEEIDPNSDDAEDEMFTEMGGDKIVDDFEDHDEIDEDDEDEEHNDDEDEDEDDEDDDDSPRRRRR